MTTTVKIEAHCSETKEVIITIDEGEGKTVLQTIRLLDGEKTEVYAYDYRRITVFERINQS